jgi:hypothetical protein
MWESLRYYAQAYAAPNGEAMKQRRLRARIRHQNDLPGEQQAFQNQCKASAETHPCVSH